MVMRIGGLASGIDTEQMVRDLMRVERMKVDKYFRQEEALKWKREALNTTNKTLADFILKARSNFGLTRTTGTGTILRSSIQNFDWVKKVNSSDENIIKATASATAMEGTYKIKVKQLADVASVMSVKIQGVEENEEGTNLLNENGEFIKGGSFKITTKTGSKVFTIGEGDKEIKTINELVKGINNAVDDGDEEISLGLRAAYDANLGKLMITTKEQGSEQFIKIENVLEGELAENIFGGGSAVFGPGGAKGQDAEFWFNESDPNENNIIKQPSNNFTMFGVNYQLQSADKDKEVTIKVESDVDGIFDKVKEFVDNYNELIDELNGFLKEKHYRDFQPLTKEEKEAMTEKEIELWEEKAKSGLLRNDETITKMLQTMRDGLYGNVYDGWEYETGKDENRLDGFFHITQIGITTGNYQSGGRLEINEGKLRSAIIENPDGVINLLFKTSDTTVPQLGEKPTSDQIEARNKALAEKHANSGLIERLFDDMVIGMKDIVRRAGAGEDANTLRNVQSNMLIDFVTSGSISVMDRDLMNLGKRIAREEMILMRREERYWSQFTAMEKALEKMNQQSTWLMSQLGQMGR